MSVRSDWNLELQLEQTRDLAEGDVRAAVVRVLDHIASAPKSRFRGGRKLLELLEEARSTAEGGPLAERLSDAISYADNQMLRQDFEERYELWGASLDQDVKFAARTAGAAIDYWTGVGNAFLADHPDASGPELLAHIQAMKAELPYMDAPEDRPGRYRKELLDAAERSLDPA
ncbi:hypothetical protein [Actinosynnema sp. NPDC020468]|uniref:hypothetical protein n=1 Tax=Actinosynnema sp. NPDC020468 TaxID=3154488 RepID=UPI0034108575